MAILWDLPVDAVRHTFQFFALQCLARLDSAVCKRKDRTFLLACMSGFRVQSYTHKKDVILKWMKCRGLKLENYVARCGSDVEAVQQASVVFESLTTLCMFDSNQQEILRTLVDVIPANTLNSVFVCSFGFDLNPRGRWTELDLAALFVEQSALRCISLNEDEAVTDFSLDQIGLHCPRLEYIEVQGKLVQFNTAVFTQLLDRCKYLTSISIRGQTVCDKTLHLIASHSRNLKVLRLSYCVSITDLGLLSVVQKCAQLTTLDVSGCSLITANGILSCGKHCAQLVCFASSVRGAAETLVPFFKQQCNLTRFSGVIDNDAMYSYSQYWRAMLSLTLSDSNLNDSAIYAMVRHCRALTSLNVQNNPLLTNASMFLVALNLPNLKSLFIDGCSEIGDDGIIALSNDCNKLTFIMMGKSDNLTTKGLQRLASKRGRFLDLFIVDPCAHIAQKDWNKIY